MCTYNKLTLPWPHIELAFRISHIWGMKRREVYTLPVAPFVLDDSLSHQRNPLLSLFPPGKLTRQVAWHEIITGETKSDGICRNERSPLAGLRYELKSYDDHTKWWFRIDKSLKFKSSKFQTKPPPPPKTAPTPFRRPVPTPSAKQRVVRCIWPRDSNGPVMADLPSGKVTENNQRVWGATLEDFHYVRPFPKASSVTTRMCGSRLAAWMKEVGEVEHAKEEIQWEFRGALTRMYRVVVVVDFLA
ncbi:uncharacterized protein BT62DRAFT_1010532 [Guyanagaster necrorhizus]|uniref:Uncharacterized protein n=1 Tax=Guyanagaster necrorhizus TaxID=856835 RepID=A0A9P7VKA1_9AGAR|nr:uncharacterized protein BT62DRAFT_1010532 [Guyanagaster necrorhizus MCA 3950]KAG7442269.1 hypothetical protein BT62DRAFT_1010532 [Guyanagaster necrorhizus MCA 3950]